MNTAPDPRAHAKNLFTQGTYAPDRFGTPGADGVADEPRNGSVFDHPDETRELTTWEPVDLGPWLSGEVSQPQPCAGIVRSDGQRLLYPGREHAVLGETESGKTWFALGCAAAELSLGNPVVYVHFEESDPGSTVERLQMLGVVPADITAGLRFIAPRQPARTEWISSLLTPAPILSVLDGVNEAMSLHGADIMAAEGASTFRRRLVIPFLRAGTGTLACDHFPKVRDGHGRDAYGSVHKGNALDGARFVLENTAPFGRHMRGASNVFLTKDRPGQLRAHGRPTNLPGKTFIGTMTFDATDSPDYGMRFHAPRDDNQPPEDTTHTDTVLDVLTAQPDQSVQSLRALSAQIRVSGHQMRQTAIKDAIDDLIADGRVIEFPGPRNATGYKAATDSHQPDQ